MQDAVLNLCRVKLRDQQRLERTGTMHEYPQYPDGKFGEAVPRAGNASGGGQPGWILRARAGRPTRMPTSTSSRRRRCGLRCAR